MLQGFHIITYALHIYYLNLFIAFLTPKVDPITYDDVTEDDDNEPTLPTSNQQAEFKPFIRRLNEFKVEIKNSLDSDKSDFLSFGGGQRAQQERLF